MSGIKRTFAIDGVPTATGPWARTVEWNGMIFISGIRGIETETGLPAETVEKRIELIFEQLGLILAHHGSDAMSVLSSTVFVTDMARLRPVINEAYEAFFGPEWPTRSIVEVSGLNQQDDMEIEFVAVRSKQS
ncbi:RidA family protein [Labrenzia sp. 011]|uniref:RidA family protein n=1 Tax=Labrenzia sp. 011 TaxID=2171494 RepID=UPI000D515B54|nr:RidA family protein [Labrenzia sp. 011]PVB63180.1 hypothetical protein DCO57_04805 [Labrenzia sp. 011]